MKTPRICTLRFNNPKANEAIKTGLVQSSNKAPPAHWHPAHYVGRGKELIIIYKLTGMSSNTNTHTQNGNKQCTHTTQQYTHTGIPDTTTRTACSSVLGWDRTLLVRGRNESNWILRTHWWWCCCHATWSNLGFSILPENTDVRWRSQGSNHDLLTAVIHCLYTVM